MILTHRHSNRKNESTNNKARNEGRYSEQSELEIRAFMAETIENDCIFGLFSERDRLEVAEAKSLEFMRAHCHSIYDEEYLRGMCFSEL